MMCSKFIRSFTKYPAFPNSRSYKNFGHKRQPTPGVTVLWHGFLTFTFIGLAVEWKRIARFIVGDYSSENVEPTDPAPLK